MTSKLSDVERIKTESRYLRGRLIDSLADDITGAIHPDDTQVIKFHGSYQQDDRDIRAERQEQKLEPLYSFMLRVRMPGGVATPTQWLAMDELARTYGNNTLKLTTRQAFQLHGVLKRNLKATIQKMNSVALDTIAACGDINRNILCSTTPEQSAVWQRVYEDVKAVAELLLPKTRAYHEIWLDGEKVEGGESEPIYGATYLPRKFKTAFVVPPVNDVDVFAHDMGFIAVVENGELLGYNVTVGGGLGSTHGDKTTYPRLASTLGFITPDKVLAVAEHIVTVQRDWGNRETRKWARLKYTIDRVGVDVFKAEVEKRANVVFAPTREFSFDTNTDRFGWTEGVNGTHHLTLRVEGGRVIDRPGELWLTGLREIAKIHRGDFRLTANQNLVIANVPSAQRAAIDALVLRYGLNAYATFSKLRQRAIACVALPTCSLAFAEAERYLPEFSQKIEALLQKNGLLHLPLHLRITGCPNGCGRPWLSEIGLIGKAPGKYNLYLGGDQAGTRFNVLYKETLDEQQILSELDGLIARFARERKPQESFGDWVARNEIVTVAA